VEVASLGKASVAAHVACRVTASVAAQVAVKVADQELAEAVDLVAATSS